MERKAWNIGLFFGSCLDDYNFHCRLRQRKRKAKRICQPDIPYASVLLAFRKKGENLHRYMPNTGRRKSEVVALSTFMHESTGMVPIVF